MGSAVGLRNALGQLSWWVGVCVGDCPPSSLHPSGSPGLAPQALDCHLGCGFFLWMVSPSRRSPSAPTCCTCCGELGLLGRSQFSRCLWKLCPSKNNCRLQWSPAVTTKECQCVPAGPLALFRAFSGCEWPAWQQGICKEHARGVSL